MVSVEFDLNTESETNAFFGAFFKFVEAASIADTDSISVHADLNGGHQIKVVNFEDAIQANEFQSYWSQRRRWLGI